MKDSIDTPPDPLSAEELIKRILLLRSPAYQKLSRIHAELLEDYERQARCRNLQIPNP